MRFLHTSDWHLGRQFAGLSLEDDHATILSQVEAAVLEHKPDALIIAGDIFDRVAPPASAIRQFNSFVRRISAETETAIVIIAGNHDSGDRIGAWGVLAAGARALISGPLEPIIEPLILKDGGGPVAISALPFGYEYMARECFGQDDINCPADVICTQLKAARAHVPDGARWVVVAHTFVEGAQNSDSERPLGRTVGGIETVPASVFDGAHYVALGHLHRPQETGAPHIRYSGSPLAFGFDEAGQEKSMAVVDLMTDGSVSVTLLPFTPLRRVRTLRGKLSELLAGQESSEDFIKVILTDETPQIDPMKRIRASHPNAVQLIYERDEPQTEQSSSAEAPKAADPKDVIGSFLAACRNKPASAAEETLILDALNQLTIEDDAA